MYVEVKEPAANDPCTAPAAPASDCISATFASLPQMFFFPCDAHSSIHSPIVDEG